MKIKKGLVLVFIGITWILALFIFNNLEEKKEGIEQYTEKKFNELTIDYDDVEYSKKISSMEDGKFYLEIVQQKNEELALFAMYDNEGIIYSSYAPIVSDRNSMHGIIMTYDRYEYKFGVYLDDVSLTYKGEYIDLVQKVVGVPKYGDVTLWYMKMKKDIDFNEDLLVIEE